MIVLWFLIDFWGVCGPSGKALGSQGCPLGLLEAGLDFVDLSVYSGDPQELRQHAQVRVTVHFAGPYNSITDRRISMHFK